MRILITISLLFALFLTPLNSVIAQDGFDECGDYAATLSSDLESFLAMADNTNMQDMGEVGQLYIQLLTMRYRYEDMYSNILLDTPPCIMQMHFLALKVINNLIDVTTLSLAWYADETNRPGYEAALDVARTRGSQLIEELMTEMQIWDTTNYTDSSFTTDASSGFICPSNCDEARAMGVSASQAAACGLDRDGDGLACYGD